VARYYKCLGIVIISDKTEQCVNLSVNVTGKVALVHIMKVVKRGKAPLILNFTTQLLELSLISQPLYPPEKPPVSIKQKSTWAQKVV
jgi:hypothetical protein